MVIGITGTDGSGKGAVVEHLVSKYGYTHYSSRDFIVTEMERLGLPMDRNQMRLTANSLRETFGNDVVVKKAFAKAEEEKKDLVVIESIRTKAEAEYLINEGGVLLAVDAEPKLRYSRIQSRRSVSDDVTYEQFLAHEELEKNDPNPHGMQKAKVMQMASYTILNNSSREDLHKEIDQWLNGLK